VQTGPVVDATTLGASPTIYLNDWRFHIGDAPDANGTGTPSWARPDFDDSQWPVITTDKRLADQGFKQGFPGFCWYRIRIQVPAHANLSVYLADVLSTYQIFEDGVKVGQYGGLPPHERRLETTARAYPVPSLSQPGTIVVVVRVWAHPVQSPPGIEPDSSYVGHSAAIANLRRVYLLDQFHHEIQEIVHAGIDLVMGAVLLFVFLGQRRQREWLWLGLAFLADSVASAVSELQVFGHVSMDVRFPIFFALNYLNLILSIEFIVTFVGVRPNRWIRGFQGLLMLAMLSTLFNFSFLPWVTEVLIIGQFLGIFGLLTLGVLVFWFARGNREAGILIIPLGLSTITSVADILGNAAYALGLQHTRQPHSLLPVFHLGGDVFDSDFVLSTLWVIAILFILLRRSARVSREKQQLDSELEAARSVQELVLARSNISTPGFVVESSYQPAQQLGGDFFLVSPGEDGSLTLVLGDVSGKGLAAAMRISLILGALRRETSRSPAEILTNLNAVLCGQIKGFATCCATHIASDGALTIANAGHLSPYLNGRELPLENALPLAIDPATLYTETQHRLAPSDKLTFLSDGVVEARSVTGELYGFDRTEAISAQSAVSIAQAAQAFGPVGQQDDDITVVTIALQPQFA
jgi:sigma-B regulation protein RsbU (phosphoserine phosphatase)